MMINIHVPLMLKPILRCPGFQIHISVIKSLSEDQYEWFSIYDHDDLRNLGIEINFSKKLFFMKISAEDW